MPPQADTRWTEPKKLLARFVVGGKKKLEEPAVSVRFPFPRFRRSVRMRMRSLAAARCFSLAVHDGEHVWRHEAASVVTATDAVCAPVQIAARVARAMVARGLCCRPEWRREMCARRLRHSVRAMVSGGYQLLTTGQRARLCVCAPEGYDGSSAAGNLPARRGRVSVAFRPPPKKGKSRYAHTISLT